MRYTVVCFEFFGYMAQFNTITKKHFWVKSHAIEYAKNFCQSKKEVKARVYDTWCNPAKLVEF